jgi:hypothetical protein
MIIVDQTLEKKDECSNLPRAYCCLALPVLRLHENGERLNIDVRQINGAFETGPTENAFSTPRFEGPVSSTD